MVYISIVSWVLRQVTCSKREKHTEVFKILVTDICVKLYTEEKEEKY
jgi:hypothetical protein